jgi:dephospho-CoA kinase
VDDVADRIEVELGPGLLRGDKINRPALAELVFRNPAALARLEGIVHPEVARRAATERAAHPADQIVVYDVALLTEKGLADQFDRVVVVQAPMEQRLTRLKKRGLSREHALARMAQQATDSQRAAIADVVVNNDASLEELREAAAEVWRTIAP